MLKELKMKYLRTTFFLFFLCASCSDTADSVDSNPLIGNWVSEEFKEIDDENYFQSVELHFDANGSYESFSAIRDIDTQEIKGFRSKASGTYSVKGDILTTIPSEAYIHDDSKGLFTIFEEMQFAQEYVGIKGESRFLIDDSQNILRFLFKPCGAFELCVPYFEYHRMQE